jgi:hypothetical protein
VWRYEQPGCGASARPVCGSPLEDLCLRLVCSCAGKVIGGCDFYGQPWRADVVINSFSARTGDPCP